MFSPKCGKSGQTVETYCRQCGVFLPDLSKPPAKAAITHAEHVTANMVLSLMTIITSFTLAALLYSKLAFRSDTNTLIYVTTGLLLAMGIWHIQVFGLTLMLRKHIKKITSPQTSETELGQ